MVGYIAAEEVRAALRPRLNDALTDQTALCEGAARLLLRYAPYRETLSDLAWRMESYLFDSLYDLLGDSMSFLGDKGETVRIRMQDLPDLADDVLGVLFDHMQVYSVTYEKLKEYSMRTGSLSAMRVLYQKFDAFQPPEEKALIARVVRDGYPPERYGAWQPPVSSPDP